MSGTIGRDAEGNEIYLAPSEADARVAALQQQVAAKADAASVDAALASKADASSVPQPGTGSPTAVVDANSGTAGAAGKYAPFNHTHPSKVRKAKTTVNATSFTWTYPTAFDAGVTPIVNAIAQVASGNTDLYNVQVMGAPSNTQCVFQINRVSSGLLSLLLGAMSINPTPGNITLHMIALEP